MRMARACGSVIARHRRYWIAFAVALLAMGLVDTQTLNPYAKHTVSIYLFGKTLAAAGCWYIVTKLFFPYSDLSADLEASRAAQPGDITAAANVLASALIRVGTAILVAYVWSTV